MLGWSIISNGRKSSVHIWIGKHKEHPLLHFSVFILFIHLSQHRDSDYCFSFILPVLLISVYAVIMENCEFMKNNSFFILFSCRLQRFDPIFLNEKNRDEKKEHYKETFTFFFLHKIWHNVYRTVHWVLFFVCKQIIDPSAWVQQTLNALILCHCFCIFHAELFVCVLAFKWMQQLLLLTFTCTSRSEKRKRGEKLSFHSGAAEL